MAKRVTTSAVNWTFVTETLTKIDRQRVLPLKAQSEKYLREISSRPAELPKIDWNIYKARIGTPGMVESFQRSYEALKIPYPSDQGELSKTEASNNEMNKFAVAKYNELLETVKELKMKLAKLEGVMKYSDMTMEEFYLSRPDYRIDDDNPKFWPQNFPLEERTKET